VWTADGVSLAVFDLKAGDAGRSVALAHATGFCGPVWAPVAASLPASVGRAVAWDFRGHGRSERPGVPLSWWDCERDVRAVLANTDLDGPIGVGHSMGGVALIMAELTRPGSFSGLVLVEPIVGSQPVRRADHPMAVQARRRRRRFEAPGAVHAAYAARPPFSTWEPAALEAYLAGGLVDDGEDCTLACDPEIEAEVFTGAPAHGTLARLGELDLPVHIVVGSAEDTYPVAWAEHLTGLIAGARLTVVEGGNHFLPMERPELVAAEIAAMQVPGDHELTRRR